MRNEELNLIIKKLVSKPYVKEEKALNKRFMEIITNQPKEDDNSIPRMF